MQFVRFGFVIINATFAQLCIAPSISLSLPLIVPNLCNMRVPSVRIQLSNWQQAAKIIASEMIEWNKFDYKLVLLIYTYISSFNQTQTRATETEKKRRARTFVDRSHSYSNRLHESTNTILFIIDMRLMCAAKTTYNVTSWPNLMLERKIWRKHFAHIAPAYLHRNAICCKYIII